MDRLELPLALNPIGVLLKIKTDAVNIIQKHGIIANRADQTGKSTRRGTDSLKRDALDRRNGYRQYGRNDGNDYENLN